MLDAQFIPAVESASRRLLVVLHGLGDSSRGYEWLPDDLGLPGMNYLLVNAPDRYYGGYSWFDFMGDWAPGLHRSRARLGELLEAQRAAGFPSEQTTLFGFSQGCILTVETGFRYPHRLAGLVGISGTVLDPEALLRELSPAAPSQRMLFTLGNADPFFRLEDVRARVAQLRAAGLSIDWRELAKAHTIAGQEELGLIREFVRAGYE
jgi:phospholipase/carboxylesterase